MRFIFPRSFFFLLFIVLGVFIAVSRSSWFIVWCGLEINLIRFIPLIIQLKNISEIESAVKYFLIQSVGSAFILFGACLSFFSRLSWVGSLFSIICCFGLIVKLGVFPFYFWLPGVIVNMNWLPCMLVATWQKVAPFVILITVCSYSYAILAWLGAGSSVVGGILGMNQVNLKALLAYSSIGHIGWILRISQFRISISFFYLCLYLFTNLVVFFLLMKINLSWVGGIKNNFLFSVHPWAVLVLRGRFLTLRGIPPLVGFFPKIIGLEILMSNGLYFGGLVLLVGSCFSLYYYISIVLNCCSNSQVWLRSFVKSSSFRWFWCWFLVFNFLLVCLMFFVLKC